MTLPSVASLAVPRPKLPKAVLTRPRRLAASPPPEGWLVLYPPPLRWESVYACVTFSVTLHPRHADVAPARALAAPRGALLLWYRRRRKGERRRRPRGWAAGRSGASFVGVRRGRPRSLRVAAQTYQPKGGFVTLMFTVKCADVTARDDVP